MAKDNSTEHENQLTALVNDMNLATLRGDLEEAEILHTIFLGATLGERAVRYCVLPPDREQVKLYNPANQYLE